ncbi:MAG: hypothetical protein KIS66_12460 [Fimbriimonadaceae bacterium]|nr:hypothetical protein [Fimbriimonadaceae bacterium]
MVSVLLVVSMLQTAPSELRAYLDAPDSNYAWRQVPGEDRPVQLELTSQRWQGLLWKHRLVVIEPPRPTVRGTAILHVTGGDPNPRDREWMTRLADRSGLPVVGLFHIPNQPLFDDLSEDALIAFTFLRYLESGDPTWPLLFPMTKSVVRAMDALQAWSAKGANPLKRFLINGASKRGWTTWLAGAAGDRRIAGIAPMVYDNLNLVAQMKRQGEVYAGASEMIGDYARAGLLEELATPEGQRLARMVDPFSYRRRVSVPTLVINGANDPYWPVDALSLYWSELRQRKAALFVPNAGHDLGDVGYYQATLAAWARSVARGERFPSVSWKASGQDLQVRANDGKPTRYRLWVAESSSLDFRPSTWRVAGTATGGSTATLTVPTRSRRVAAFVEAEFDRPDGSFSLSTGPTVFAK